MRFGQVSDALAQHKDTFAYRERSQRRIADVDQFVHQRSGLRGVAGVVAAAVLLAGCGASSAPLPAGRWGKVISCLQGHPAFSVSEAGTGNDPGVQTGAVVVLDQLSGDFLAYVGNNRMGADDITGTEAANVDDVDGPIHYGFSDQADDQNRLDVGGCVTGQYGS